MRILIYFFLIFFYSSFLFSSQEAVKISKVNVSKEFSEKSYCKNYDSFFLKDFNKTHYPIKIEIRTNKFKTWYTNLIKAFYSTPRSTWSIDRDYKKYFNAKFIVHFNDEVKCKFNGKVKIHGGRKDHIDIKNLMSSLRVKFHDGHINHSKHFGLLRPFTRNSDDEIFITTILKELRLISPETFYIKVKFNNHPVEKMIFLDQDYENILRINNRNNGIVLAENKTTGFNKEFSLGRVISDLNGVFHSFELEKNSYFNALDKINYIILNEKFYKKENIFNNSNNNSFINQKNFIDFYLMMIATGGDHGYQLGDRRYYYNTILDEIEPVYYDWKPTLITENFSLNNSNYPRNFESADIARLINKINNLNFFEINQKLEQKGMSFKDNEILTIKKKLIKNLNAIKKQKIIKDKNLEISKFEYDYFLLFHADKNDYLKCNLKKICEKITISNLEEKKLLRNHQYKINNEIFKLTRKTFDEFQNNTLPLNYSIKKMNILNLSNNSKIYFNDNVIVEKKEKNLEINFLNEYGRIIVHKGELVDFNFKINLSNRSKNHDLKLQDYNNYIPYCVAFHDVKLTDLEIEINNLQGCSAAINFINSSGNIKKIKILNTYGDALLSQLSNLHFEDIEVYNTEDDCIELQSGNYLIDKAKLSNCWDKSIQLRHKSYAKIKYLEVDESLYGPTVMNSSFLDIDRSIVNTDRECLVAYRENNEFYGSKIFINKELSCLNKAFSAQEGSLIKFADVIQN